MADLQSIAQDRQGQNACGPAAVSTAGGSVVHDQASTVLAANARINEKVADLARYNSVQYTREARNTPTGGRPQAPGHLRVSDTAGGQCA